MAARDRLIALLGRDAVLTEPSDTARYLTDHRRLYVGRALAVLRPRSVDEVAHAVAWCHAEGIGVVPQGGNTGYCGGATPDATGAQVVVSLERLNRIRGIDATNDTLTAEAGCTLAAVQAAAAAVDRLFPLSLGSEGTCQIGGNLATNAGGTAVLRYGMMRDLALGLEVVLADGTRWSSLSGLRKDNTGFDLDDLLIGSEGTLGIITAASLRLYPAVRSRATAWIGVRDPDCALAVLARLRSGCGDRLSTCELVPDVALSLVVEHIPGSRLPLAAATPWNLLVEIGSSTVDENLDELLQRVLAPAIEDGEAIDVVLAGTLAQRDALWRLRESVPEAQRQSGASLKHDLSVPVSALPRLIRDGTALAERVAPEGFVVAYGHVGDGNLHFNLNQRPGAQRASFDAREAPLRRALHDLVASLGGSFSAEHGIGRLKVDELARYAPPARLAAMRAIKQALDPIGILNPGKVLASNDDGGRQP